MAVIPINIITFLSNINIKKINRRNRKSCPKNIMGITNKEYVGKLCPIILAKR